MEISEALLNFEFAALLKMNTGCLSLSELKRKAGLQLEAFANLARRQLADRYIDIPPAISLVNCPNCAVTLGSSHTHTEAIIDWLVGNLSIHEAFKEVELMYELIHLVEHRECFAKDSQCFHIGLTSLGAIAYFEDARCY